MRFPINSIDSITNFLASIGIPVIEENLPDITFLPGMTVRGSSIIVDLKKLKYPGNLLHEAGNIAVTEGKSNHEYYKSKFRSKQ